MGGLTVSTLGIWIPTWNRAQHFQQLIASLEPQHHNVTVMAGLNPPCDDYIIPEWCQPVYNETNIGQARNILQGITALDTDYLWMIGDDDELQPGAIEEIEEHLTLKPGMIICTDGKFDHGPTGYFETWPDWMDACLAQGREVMLTAQTFMTSTVFRRSGVDIEAATAEIDSRYGHHFGILKGLMWEPVTVTRKPVFIAGSAQNSSIYQESAEYLDSHGNITSDALRRLIAFASELSGREYPPTSYISGVGFDT